GVEALYTIMGPGCKTVTRVHTKDTDYVTGTWKDGRIGTFRGIRKGKQDYGALVFGSKGIAPSGGYGGYQTPVGEDCQILPNGQSAGECRGDPGDVRVHGSRRRE